VHILIQEVILIVHSILFGGECYILFYLLFILWFGKVGISLRGDKGYGYIFMLDFSHHISYEPTTTFSVVNPYLLDPAMALYQGVILTVPRLDRQYPVP